MSIVVISEVNTFETPRVTLLETQYLSRGYFVPEKLTQTLGHPKGKSENVLPLKFLYS